MRSYPSQPKRSTGYNCLQLGFVTRQKNVLLKRLQVTLKKQGSQEKVMEFRYFEEGKSTQN